MVAHLNVENVVTTATIARHTTGSVKAVAQRDERGGKLQKTADEHAEPEGRDEDDGRESLAREARIVSAPDDGGATHQRGGVSQDEDGNGIRSTRGGVCARVSAVVRGGVRGSVHVRIGPSSGLCSGRRSSSKYNAPISKSVVYHVCNE